MARPLVRVLGAPALPATHEPPSLTRDQHVELFGHMVFCRILDEKMLGLQRQGRIGFYGPGSGQEAAAAASAYALESRDWIFPALREGAALLMRGFPLELYIAQMMGNSLDPAKGRQMPCHFSSRAHRFVSLSSVIGTQVPQAVGAAWAAKIRGDDVVVMGYLGDGATSSSDFHVAMTFAQVYEVPCVLFCQNNQWAISVPFAMQTASDGIAIKAAGYGMEGVAVDGNDALAVLAVTRRAVAKARAGGGPTLIEAITYRRGGHSSSDDPTRYRNEDAVEPWLLLDPIDRYREWLTSHAGWTEAEEAALREGFKTMIDTAVRAVEAAPAPAPETLFEDVCAELPDELARQRDVCLGFARTGQAEGAFPL